MLYQFAAVPAPRVALQVPGRKCRLGKFCRAVSGVL